MGTLRVPICDGNAFVVVDEEDYALACRHKWYMHWAKTRRTWYPAYQATDSNGKRYYIFLHRLVMDAAQGIPVDHINGDGWDCRRENLRLVTHQQNCQNRRQRSDSTSPYKGVVWQAAKRRWQAVLECDGKKYRSKRYVSPEDAARAYDRIAVEVFGEYAKTNFSQLSLL